MAPLVVLRSGSQSVEYRDVRGVWRRRRRYAHCGCGCGCGCEHDDAEEEEEEEAEAEGLLACDRCGRRKRCVRGDESLDDHELDDSEDEDQDRDAAGEHDGEEADRPPSWRSLYGFSSELHDLPALRAFRCVDCGTVVASRADVIAKSFFGRTGKAYLMNAMFNVRMGTPRNRYLMTGMHTICDVMCTTCEAVLGWQYIRAMELSQKYKEGKFIMERAIVHDDAEEETWQRR
ncbi:hypothetical protein P43SY_005338 [Pythium insidiosum]|uniref:Yippee domain-containing protein n=1 Tax=Pythium insidiosum TaxID=114742 RepID=A0AAD5Q9M9_PYTIN|nr:hypothetical protein P43SY_005338 [Pythium insidiosum]